MTHPFIVKTIDICKRLLLPTNASNDTSQHIIYALLVNEGPCMIARFGSAEIQGVISGILPPH